MVNPAGFEMSRLLHFAPEVGYYLSPDLMLSVQLRFQLITGVTAYHGEPAEVRQRRCLPGGQVRIRRLRANSYFFGEGDLRTYVAGIGGLGRSGTRHVRVEPDLRRRPEPTCVDTVPSGPVFVGGGAGSCTTSALRSR